MTMSDESLIRQSQSHHPDTVGASFVSGVEDCVTTATFATRTPEDLHDAVTARRYLAPMTSVHDVAAALLDSLGLDRRTTAFSDRLHLLLYYVEGHYAAAHNQALFAEPMIAGPDGPIVVGFAGADIDRQGHVDEAVTNIVGYVVSRYGRLSTLDLQHLTKAEPPWQSAAQSPSRRIDLREMIAYFAGPGAPFDAYEEVAMPAAVRKSVLAGTADPGPGVPDDMDALLAKYGR